MIEKKHLYDNKWNEMVLVYSELDGEDAIEIGGVLFIYDVKRFITVLQELVSEETR